MAAHVIDNRSINIRTSDPLCTRSNNLAARDDGNVSRPAADINNRRALGVMSADAGAKGRSQPFFDHAHAPDPCMLGGAQQRAPFNRRNVRKNAHQRTAAKVWDAAAGLADEMGQHVPCSFEVSNYAVLQWRNNGHATRLAAVLLLRFSADADYFSR